MFYIQGNNIEMTRGDTLHAVINMRDPLGVISYPETGDVVTFNAMLTRDGEAVITKTIPHDTMTLTLDPEDTEELAYGRYIFTVRITRANGDVDTFIDDGTLTLVKTWRHKPHDAYVPWNPWIPLNSMNGWLAPGALNISSDHPVQNKVLYQALAGKVDKVEGMGLSHNDLTDALAQKLTDIETGATKTIVDALFVSGSTNPVQSKTIQAALAAKVDKEVGKGLSSNDYTSAEKEKLSGIEAGAQVNPDLSGYALKSEIHDLPSGGTTDQVLAKASNSDHDYKWITVEGGGGGGSVTVDDTLSGTSENPVQNKVIKAALDGKVDAVEGKVLSDNNYTDTEKLKLAGIAAGANKTTVDSSLSATSANPVRNSVVTNELNTKADKVTEVTVATGGAVSQTLEAGKWYHFTGALTGLTITLTAPASGEVAQYHFDFTTGATAPTLTLPDSVIMPDGFSVEANKRYEVDILNNFGAVMAWAIS